MSNRSVRDRSAFTIIEILLVIALIGLLTSLFVVSFDVLVRQSESDAVETSFWTAVREARSRALISRHPQSLRYDEKTLRFVVEDEITGAVRTEAIERDTWPPDVAPEITFNKRLPPNQFSLRQGELVTLREIPLVRFFPDGTCTPFVVKLAILGSEREIEIDPWTGAELLVANNEK